jgi:hypothetical protein
MGLGKTQHVPRIMIELTINVSLISTKRSESNELLYDCPIMVNENGGDIPVSAIKSKSIEFKWCESALVS